MSERTSTRPPDDSPTPLLFGPFTRIVKRLHDYPKRGLLAVLLFIAVAGVIGAPGVGGLSAEGGFTPGDADSIRAVERIEEATGLKASPGIVLLVEAPGGPDDPSVREASDILADVDGVAEVTPAGVSEDGTAALVLGTLDADADDSAVAEAVIDRFEDSPEVTVGGGAAAGLQLGEQIGEDLGRAELFAFPILLVLALLFFGRRAAILPVVVGVATVLGTFLALSGINEVYGVSTFALNLVIGLGLGLAVDYTLFLVTRYREELEQQGPSLGAVVTTMRTAGRTVLFSAATVAVALATLTIFPMGFLTSMGLAGVVVTVVAAAAALTVSPILFGLWGAKLARPRNQDAAAGRWYRFSHLVMRRPGLFAVATTAVMLVLAAPALRTEWTPVDETVIPPSQTARTVSDTIGRDFADTGTTPVTIVIDTSESNEDVTAFASELGAVSNVASQADPVDLGADTWLVNLEVAGDAAGEDAIAVVDDVRALIETEGVDALVAGPAAEFIDQQDAIADNLLLVISLLFVMTMLVLWLMTGSVMLPVKAVVMNVLTVGVALAAVTWIYQDGRLTGLLGYTPNGGIEPTNFLISATVVFALSTDYGVFLLGRVKEARESGLPERESVAVGLSRTGSVVTAASILLAVAIGAFSVSEISFIQQIGIAAAVGVLVDAFIVRTALVPALMGLMGKWNWWAPMWLRRVHDKVGLSEGEPAKDTPRGGRSQDAPQITVGR